MVNVILMGHVLDNSLGPFSEMFAQSIFKHSKSGQNAAVYEQEIRSVSGITTAGAKRFFDMSNFFKFGLFLVSWKIVESDNKCPSVLK